MSDFLSTVFDFRADDLAASARWLRVAGCLCLWGFGSALLSAWWRWRLARTGGVRAARENAASVCALVGLIGALAATFVSVWARGIEVNHFPSQNMTEVLVMFGLATLISMLVLHFVLKLRSVGPGWAVVDDVLLALVFALILGTHYYASSLPNAQRDLPPALQSYWFPPHLAALIFSYATLGIAGLICAVYFCMRFWLGALSGAGRSGQGGGRSRWSQIAILALLVLLPFTHLVTIPLWLLVGAVFWMLHRRGGLPDASTLAAVEKTMDEASYRAFAVGIPFLTAGLFMGAFWAQEAWANYWGWDSKENSALITWLVYVGYIHLRMLGGYRGEKSMAVLLCGALSIFMTFQLFGYLPDTLKNSQHKYTEFEIKPREGQQGTKSASTEQARANPPGSKKR